LIKHRGTTSEKHTLEKGQKEGTTVNKHDQVTCGKVKRRGSEKTHRSKARRATALIGMRKEPRGKEKKNEEEPGGGRRRMSRQFLRGEVTGRAGEDTATVKGYTTKGGKGYGEGTSDPCHSVGMGGIRGNKSRPPLTKEKNTVLEETTKAEKEPRSWEGRRERRAPDFLEKATQL